MENILFYASIRGVQPECGILPHSTVSINLDIYKDTINFEFLSLPYLYTIVQDILKKHKITNNLKFRLFIVGSNSINIAIPFILNKLGYQYEILPKPTDSNHWGFIDNDVKFKESHSFLYKMNATDTLIGIDCCIKLQGKFTINGAQEVYMPKKDKIAIIKRILTQVNNIDEFDKIYVTHRLTLPEIYKSLTDKKVCQQFEEDFQKIMDELLTKKAKRVHILSSIPAIGLQIIGKIIAQEPYRDMDFCLYDFESENQYHLVSALNTKTLQNFIDKGE